jgi:hypothetical protein
MRPSERLEIKRLKTEWELRALDREARRREARLEALRAAKLNALSPWVGSNEQQRASWSTGSRFPLNLGD